MLTTCRREGKILHFRVLARPAIDEHASAEEAEYLRLKADRWMKFKHLPAALMHNPRLVLRRAHKMAAHTFRGATLKTFLGLEDEREAFERYREIRKAERVYV